MSEANQKLIVKEDAYQELEKELANTKQQLHKQKKNETLANQAHIRQIERERKAADLALHKLRNHEKGEKEMNKKQIMINQLRAKIQNLEQEAYHNQKVLRLKRAQIEQEKTELIYKQNKR